MSILKRISLLVIAIVTINITAFGEDSHLSGNIRIKSEQLGYPLQYRVYTPAGYNDTDNLPSIYVTDGQWYIRGGGMRHVLDRQIEKGAIKPVVAVFVDSRNPLETNQNRRNQQFFCNVDYASFFEKELVPTISENYKVSANRDDRVILGMSFGGLNAACFGMTATGTFKGIAMQSPAMHPVPQLYDTYRDQPTQPIDIFFSIGTKNDNTRAGRKFKKILEEKNYELSYIEVPYGHTWRNWKPLLDDVLLHFFKR